MYVFEVDEGSKDYRAVFARRRGTQLLGILDDMWSADCEKQRIEVWNSMSVKLRPVHEWGYNNLG